MTTRSSDTRELATPHLLPAAELKRFSQLNQAASLFHIALEWALVIGCAALTWHFWHPALYVLAVLFIGARQHAMFVLIHEGAHYRLLRNRRLNDWVAEVALAWPFLLFRMREYRKVHFAHHRRTNTDEDPDWVLKQTDEWVFPMRRTTLARLLLLQLSGIGFAKFIIGIVRLRKRLGGRPEFQGSNEVDERAMKIARPLFVLSLIAGVSAAGLAIPALLFWVIPYLTWMQVIYRVRSIAEHFAIDRRRGPFSETRTTLIGWFERLFVAPKNINYHLEHHLYPSVPFYRMAKFHQRLMEVSEYNRSAHLTRSYWGVLQECLGKRSTVSAPAWNAEQSAAT